MSSSDSGIDSRIIPALLLAYHEQGGDTSRFVVIGGSAAYSWYVAVVGDDHAPVMRTTDIDFQIQHDTPKRDIEAFARAVNGRVHWPGVDHHTPEFAIIEIPDHFGPGESLEIDFLPCVHGLHRGETFKRADYVSYTDAHSSKQIGYRVIHPVHVLCNIVENYLKLQRREQANLERLRALIPAVRTYIEQQATYAAETGEKSHASDVRWSIRTLLRQSSSPDYAEFTLDEGVDLLDAVPEQKAAPIKGLFWSREYPALLREVKSRRDAVRARRRNNRPRR